MNSGEATLSKPPLDSLFATPTKCNVLQSTYFLGQTILKLGILLSRANYWVLVIIIPYEDSLCLKQAKVLDL